MADKRKRGQNFVAEEKDKLVKLLGLHSNTILNKRTDGSTNEAKNKAWIEVTNAFNSSATVYRTKDSLMKLWEKMKTESKLYYQSNKRSTMGTGGGPSDVKIDPVLEQVCALLGRACTGIIGVQDSDSCLTMEVEALEDFTQVTREGNDEVETEHNLFITDETTLSNDKENQCAKPSSSHENIIKTPLWSRRRPQLSQINERTEAVSTLCTSYQNVNKKKEDIEDLKRQLLLDELQFKKKMYEVQLKTAETELEIKTEILKQVKGGAISFQSLFGVPQTKETEK